MSLAACLIDIVGLDTNISRTCLIVSFVTAILGLLLLALEAFFKNDPYFRKFSEKVVCPIYFLFHQELENVARI